MRTHHHHTGYDRVRGVEIGHKNLASLQSNVKFRQRYMVHSLIRNSTNGVWLLLLKQARRMYEILRLKQTPAVSYLINVWVGFVNNKFYTCTYLSIYKSFIETFWRNTSVYVYQKLIESNALESLFITNSLVISHRKLIISVM